MSELRLRRHRSWGRRLSLLLLPAMIFSGFVANPASAGSPYFTVTFAQNDNGADPIYASQTENTPSALTTFSNLSPAFVNAGHTFLDWNTQPDGSGISYSNGATYNFGGTLLLYAIWSNPYYTVTFDENDSGTDPVFASQTENTSGALTLFSNLSPAFVNAGHTFLDWNTQPDGSGISYSNGAVFGFGADTVVYAIWQAIPSISASFVGNGGVGSIQPLIGAVGSTLQLPSGAALSFSGYSFSGWNTAANGSGSAYAAGASIVLGANLTLYAQWTPLLFVVSFAPDGGSVNPTSSTFVFGGLPITLPSASNGSENFNGWFNAPTGGTLVGLAGATYSPTQALTLYAQWSQTQNLQIVVSLNGGSGSAPTLTGVAGATVTLPTSSSLLRSGYTLTSWNTAANGTGTSYAPGQSVTLSTSLTLYAQWKKLPTSVLYGAVGVFTAKSATLSASLKTQVRRLATTIKMKKYAKVTLYGYTAATGVASLNRSLSVARAKNVANFLKSDLRALKVRGVAITAAGEGAVTGKTASQYSRVEVFVS